MTVAAENQSASELELFDPSLDHFARLGLEPRWKIDRDALERGYLERSRRYHPDRFVGADSATRRAAVEHSAALNTAYRTLRDPVARAEYLVKLGGVDLDSSDPRTGAPQPEQALLIEMIERRERLDELRQSGSEDGREAVCDELEAEIDEVFERALAALERGDIGAAASALVHRRYLDRFLDELQQDG
ncbi:MAG: Fe-S protein assembly co-chaperone HscB [Enhygromyxa sp.]